MRGTRFAHIVEVQESPYRQLCNIAPRLQSTPLLLRWSRPINPLTFSPPRAPALLMAYDAGGGKWVAGCVQNVKTRDGTHTWSLEISDSFVGCIDISFRRSQ